MLCPFVDYLADRGLISSSVVQCLSDKAFVREPLGMIAVEHGLLNPAQIDAVLDQQRESHALFGEIAIEKGFLRPDQVGVLVKIQEFRTAASVAEALALAGVMGFEDAVTALGSFLLRDRELAAILQQ